MQTFHDIVIPSISTTLATELNNRLIKAKRINVFVWWRLYQKLKAIIPYTYTFALFEEEAGVSK